MRLQNLSQVCKLPRQRKTQANPTTKKGINVWFPCGEVLRNIKNHLTRKVVKSGVASDCTLVGTQRA